jgi:hypothetical protein
MSYANPVNLTGIVETFQYVNNVTDNYFVIMMLLSLYLIVFIYSIMRNPSDLGDHIVASAILAGFITTITAAILRVTEILTSDRILFFCVASFVVPLIIAYFHQRD